MSRLSSNHSASLGANGPASNVLSIASTNFTVDSGSSHDIAMANDWTSNGNLLKLSTYPAPDYEASAQQWSAVVNAIVNGVSSDDIQVTLNLTNVDEPPQFAQSSATTASVVSNISSSPLTVQATDPESGSVTYSLKAGAPAGFSVNTSSGAVAYDGTTLTDNEVSVTIVASDAAGNTSEHTVTVSVTIPVITLNGSSTISINQNDAYTDASAETNYGTITTTGTVDNGIVGIVQSQSRATSPDRKARGKKPDATATRQERGRLATNYRDQLYSDPQSLAGLVSISAVQADGNLKGYKVSPGRDAAQFTALGFEAGDIVTAVNGYALSDPSNTLRLYQLMRDATDATFDIDRKGSPVSINVSLSNIQ